MDLYVFRHGESVGNQQRLFSGWCQLKLTEKGVRQAEALRDRLNGLTFDCVYASDLIRAVETAQIVLPQADVIQDADLREVNVGILAGRKLVDCQQEYGEKLEISRRTRDFTPFGGEDSQALMDRAASFLYHVSQVQTDRIAVFCHEGIIKGMLSAVMGVLLDEHRFSHANCNYSVFTFTPEQGWRLLRWNV